MTISFWMDDRHIAAAKAMGALPVASPMPEWPLNVGDTISFPGFRKQAYRVVSRHYRQQAEPDQPSWLIQLEPAEPPF